MANERVAEIVAAMQRELSPELVSLLSDLPITEVPEGLDDEPEIVVEPYDPEHPDNPEGTGLDCSTVEAANGTSPTDAGEDGDGQTDAGDNGDGRAEAAEDGGDT
jgi:hypothetical protein